MDSLIFELQIVFYLQLFLSANVRHNADARRCSYFELGLPVASHHSGGVE